MKIKNKEKIEEKLGVVGLDVKEKLDEYNILKKRYTPVFWILFVLSFAFVYFEILVSEIVLAILFINTFIFSEIEKKRKHYEASEILSKKRCDKGRLEEVLNIRVKNLNKKIKQWQTIKKVYNFIYTIVIGLTLLMLFDALKIGISINHIALAIWSIGLGHMFYRNIREKEMIYEIALLLND